MKKLTALLAMMVVALALAFAPAASATATRHTLKGWHSILVGQHVGPDADTHYQYSTITGFHSIAHTGGYLYDMNLHLTPSPYATVAWVGHGTPVSRDITIRSDGTVRDSHTNQPILLDSWYNPFSWNWSHILGKVLDLMKECANGAAHGLVGSLSGPPIIAVLTRGAHIGATTPTAAATASLFGCLWGIYWSN